MCTIGDRLGRARVALGYATIDEMLASEEVPASRGSVYKYEDDVPPPFKYLSWLTRRGVSADYLLRGQGPVLRLSPEVEVRGFRFIARYVDRVRAISDGGAPGGAVVGTGRGDGGEGGSGDQRDIV